MLLTKDQGREQGRCVRKSEENRGDFTRPAEDGHPRCDRQHGAAAIFVVFAPRRFRRRSFRGVDRTGSSAAAQFRGHAIERAGARAAGNSLRYEFNSAVGHGDTPAAPQSSPAARPCSKPPRPRPKSNCFRRPRRISSVSLADHAKERTKAEKCPPTRSIPECAASSCATGRRRPGRAERVFSRIIRKMSAASSTRMPSGICLFTFACDARARPSPSERQARAQRVAKQALDGKVRSRRSPSRRTTTPIGSIHLGR